MSAARASLAYFLTRGLSGALAVATVSLFARQLGPNGYASYTLAATVAAFVGSILIQPLHSCLGRFLPANKGSGLTVALGRLLLGGGAIAALFALLLEVFRPQWLPPGVALAAAMLCVIQGVFDFSAQWASASLMARRYGRLYLLKSFLAPAMGFGMIALGAGFWGAVLGMCSAYLLATAISLPQPWTIVWKGRFDSKVLRAVSSYAKGLTLSMLLGVTLSWSDRLLMAALSVAGLGIYGAAADLTQQGFGLIFSALFLAWFPRLVSSWENGVDQYRDQLARYLRLSAALMPAVTVGFVWVCSDLAHLLLGKAFSSDAARVMPWLALAALCGGIRTYMTDIPLHLHKRLDIQGGIVAVCGVCGMGLNVILLPRYGILGAAWSSVAANAVGVALGVFQVRRMGGMPWPWRDLAISLLGVLVMSAVLYGMPEGSLLRMLARIVAGVLVFGCVALVADLAGGRTWLVLRVRARSGAC